jgi:hypothetical protein
MAFDNAKMLSQMGIGEEGFCSLQSLYGGPALPVWTPNPQVAYLPLTRTFLLDSEVYPDRSRQAMLRVKRLTMGFSVGIPDGAATIKLRRDHPPMPLPVVGADAHYFDRGS